MIVYKLVTQFDSKTGEESPTKVYDHEICDFTGEKINHNSIIYTIDYDTHDPNYGDGEGERWLYRWCRDKYGPKVDPIDSDILFGQIEYKFKTLDDGSEPLLTLIKVAEIEMEKDIISLDHLLRWSRGRMIEKCIKCDSVYKIEDFIG